MNNEGEERSDSCPNVEHLTAYKIVGVKDKEVQAETKRASDWDHFGREKRTPG